MYFANVFFVSVYTRLPLVSFIADTDPLFHSYLHFTPGLLCCFQYSLHIRIFQLKVADINDADILCHATIFKR